MSAPITARMEAAIGKLAAHWTGRRSPKAFYLVARDWADFSATNPPTVETVWGNNPPQNLVEPAFKGIPVRESTGKTSRLYDTTSAGREI